MQEVNLVVADIRYLVDLHGVGASVVNALSYYLEVYVHREGNIHYQKYKEVFQLADLEVIGETDRNWNEDSLYTRFGNFY